MNNKQLLNSKDYWIGGALLALVFVIFFHVDIWGVGWDSLNYLFGSPADFYENCKKIRGGGTNMSGTPYPPAIYLLFAVWLFPAKLFGLVQSAAQFPEYLTYWLKLLTTLAFTGSFFAFWRITGTYSNDQNWRANTTWLWILSPVALFSQFIFSQYDILYILPSLLGFHAMLKNRIFLSALLFGVAITFKYFPAFTFIPLLLFYEKHPLKLLIALAIFLAPSALLEWPYQHSAAFVEGVLNHVSVDRVYAAFVELGGPKIFYLFASFTLVCGISYMADAQTEEKERKAAFLFLVSSILPFLFILWHPQWMIGVMPAIALTTALDKRARRLLLIDLIAMVFYIGYTVVALKDNADTMMFKAELLHIPFGNSFKMATLFNHFGLHSADVYLSAFWAYLVLQIIVKYPLITEDQQPVCEVVTPCDLRLRYFGGLAIFLLPFAVAVYKDLRNPYMEFGQYSGETVNGELTTGHTFAQTFVAKIGGLQQASLLLATYARANRGLVTVSVADASGKVLARQTVDAAGLKDNEWKEFNLATPLQVGHLYRLSLQTTADSGNGISWWASQGDVMGNGTMEIDGKTVRQDFAFKLMYTR